MTPFRLWVLLTHPWSWADRLDTAFTMLAIAIALVAVLAPFLPTYASSKNLSVDLGYQINLGQRVVVRVFS